MKTRITLFVALFAIALGVSAQSSGFKELDEWVGTWKQTTQRFFGYPVNEDSKLHGFYDFLNS